MDIILTIFFDDLTAYEHIIIFSDRFTERKETAQTWAWLLVLTFVSRY